MLISRDVAPVYFRERGFMRYTSARELVEDIGSWLARRLPGSTIDKFDIAAHVLELQASTVATPEQAAFQNDQREGIGNPPDELAQRRMDELALAQRVAQASSTEWATMRRQLGIETDLVSFLGGQQ